MDASIATITGAIVALALIAVVGVLTWHGSVDGQAAMTFFAGVAGVGGGAVGNHVATKTGARAATRRNEF